MKLYEVIVDDQKNVYKTLCTAKNKKELVEVYGGNGMFEKIIDVTKNYFNDDTVDMLQKTLYQGGWGIGEIKIICALVDEHIQKTKN